MPLTVTCPSCAAKLKAPEGAAGRKVKCPRCETVIPVPVDEVVDLAGLGIQAETPERELPASARGRRDDYDDDDEAPVRPRRREYYDDDDDDDYEVRRRSRRTTAATGLQLGLGIAALAVGVLGLLTSWIPFLGAGLCGIGLVLGIVAVVVALVRGQGYAFPIAGTAVSGVSLLIGVVLTIAIVGTVRQAAQQMEAIAMQNMAQNMVPVGPPTPPSGAINLVAGRGQVNGELTLADPLDRVQLQSHCKVFTMQMKAGRTYQIDMVKRLNIRQKKFNAFPNMHLDPFLRLEDAAGNQLMIDDDGAGNLNARILFVCGQNGGFRIVATALGGGIGPFTLTVEER